MKHVENVRAIIERVSKLVIERRRYVELGKQQAQRDIEQRVFEIIGLLDNLYNINLFDIIDF